MSARGCARKWEIEAARDGRLRGKDLESAVRHRSTCPECTEEERQLAALGREISDLPVSAPDAMAARRARRRLLAAMNAAVLETPQPRAARRAAWGLALGVAALVASWLVVKRPTKSGAGARPPIVEVRAAPGARWTEHRDHDVDRVRLLEGDASFRVRRHDGRRVVIELPDGEVEDLGTVFEIHVSEQRTTLISVQEGQLAVRLRGRADFGLGAGQAWRAEAGRGAAPAATATGPGADAVLLPDREPPPSSPASEPKLDTAANPAAATPVQRRLGDHGDHGDHGGHGAHAGPSAPERQAPIEPPSAAPPDERTAKAEDDAYLRIVQLLRQAQYSKARAEAKSYLLHFPNGFRRVEVLNVATYTSGDAGADPAQP